MTDDPTLSEIHQKIRELLGRATLLRRKGQPPEAMQLVQQAVALDSNSIEAQELLGDLLLDMGKAELALESYRRAKALAPTRGALEEKIGRAALAKAQREQTIAMSSELLAGRLTTTGTPRKPGHAALLSLLVPGLGQLYNGDAGRGFVLLALYFTGLALTVVGLRVNLSVMPISPQGILYGPRVDLGSFVSALFSGLTLIWMLLLAVIWIYAIAEAGLTAGRRATAEDTGLV